MTTGHPTPKTYLLVFVALLVLLAVTCAVAFIDLDRLFPGASVAAAMLVATAKAVLILLIFMHVRGGPRRVYVFCGAGFLWLGILFVLSFSDYLTRNHPPGQSPKGEPRFLLRDISARPTSATSPLTAPPDESPAHSAASTDSQAASGSSPT